MCATIEEKSTPKLNHGAPLTFSCSHHFSFNECAIFFILGVLRDPIFNFLFSSDKMAVTVPLKLDFFSVLSWHSLGLSHIPPFGSLTISLFMYD